jgi:hypothetical protein
MRPWLIVGAAIIAAVTNASAQSDHTAPPAVSSTPNLGCEARNLGCEARTGGLTVPAPGETTGSASLSDELSRSKGLICPPAEVDPSIAVPPPGGGVMPVIPPSGTPGGDPYIVPK